MALPFALSRRSQVPAEKSSAFGAIAERFRRGGDLERAVALCQEGLQKFPDHMSARVTLGWAFLDLGRLDEARKELERVIRRAPDNLAAIRGLAALHDRMEGDVEHMEASSTSWPPPSFAVPAIAPQVAIDPEPEPVVSFSEPTPEPAGVNDLPVFQTAAQQAQDAVEQAAANSFYQHVEEEPFLPFDTAVAEPDRVVETPAQVAFAPPIAAPDAPAPVAVPAAVDPLAEFDPVFPAAPAIEASEQPAPAFAEATAPMAFEIPVERSTSPQASFALPMMKDAPPIVDPIAASAEVTDVAQAAPAYVDVTPVERVEDDEVLWDGPVHEEEAVQMHEAVQMPVPVQIHEPAQMTEPVQMSEPAQMRESELQLDAEPIAFEMPLPPVAAESTLVLDMAEPMDSVMTPDPPVFFPTRVQPVVKNQPALVALERLLLRVEERKLAALAGSLAS